MQKLTYLIDDLFQDDRRSIEDTSAGFLEHNTFLQAAPESKGALDVIKPQTLALAVRLTEIETRIGAGQALQHGGRELTQTERERALTLVRENESALRNRYVVKDAQVRARLYNLFYPDKLMPYNAASLRSLPGIIRTYLDLLETERENLPDDFYTETVADLIPFAEARRNQTLQQQGTQQAQKERAELLPRLTEQLTANLHVLCTVFRADRTQVLTYFNARYFETQPSARPGRYTARVATRHTNQVLDLAEVPPKYTQVRLSVREGVELCFFRGENSQVPVPADALTVTRATPLTLPLAELPGTGPLLLVRNGTAYVGHYVVELS